MGGNTGGGLTPQVQAQLTAMLKATKSPLSSIPASLLSIGQPTPQRNNAVSLASDARTSIIRRQGYKATVGTGPLGDVGFGTALGRPMLTGVTG